MGTETNGGTLVDTKTYGSYVKLNNPLMGTET